jgi:hypothetical protein
VACGELLGRANGDGLENVGGGSESAMGQRGSAVIAIIRVIGLTSPADGHCGHIGSWVASRDRG